MWDNVQSDSLLGHFCLENRNPCYYTGWPKGTRERWLRHLKNRTLSSGGGEAAQMYTDVYDCIRLQMYTVFTNATGVFTNVNPPPGGGRQAGAQRGSEAGRRSGADNFCHSRAEGGGQNVCVGDRAIGAGRGRREAAGEVGERSETPKHSFCPQPEAGLWQKRRRSAAAPPHCRSLAKACRPPPGGGLP